MWSSGRNDIYKSSMYHSWLLALTTASRSAFAVKKKGGDCLTQTTAAFIKSVKSLKRILQQNWFPLALHASFVFFSMPLWRKIKQGGYAVIHPRYLLITFKNCTVFLLSNVRCFHLQLDIREVYKTNGKSHIVQM